MITFVKRTDGQSAQTESTRGGKSERERKREREREKHTERRGGKKNDRQTDRELARACAGERQHCICVVTEYVHVHENNCT